jgi:hypothetical protein
MFARPINPDERVLEFAAMYVAKLREVETEKSAVARRIHLELLHLYYEAANDEANYEEKKRLCRVSRDIRERLKYKGLPSLDRAITPIEAEQIRSACSVPPTTALDSLTGEDFLDLAELYEGWAHDPRLDSVEMVRLLGWADGSRNLAATVGRDYQPPVKMPGEPDSLLKFMVRKMRET